MADNFYKFNKGVNLNPQISYGTSDPAGVNGDIYYNQLSQRFRIFQNGFWQNLGSGANSGTAQEVAIASGQTSLVVTFPVAAPSDVYTVLTQMVNTTDADPEFQPITITNKTAAGFTATWNMPTDTSNYLLDYVVSGAQEQVGEAIIGVSGTSVNVTLPIPMNTTSYVVIGEFTNYVDSNPQFQPVILTNKTLSGFTMNWNVPVPTGNYRLAYQVATFQ